MRTIQLTIQQNIRLPYSHDSDLRLESTPVEITILSDEEAPVYIGNFSDINTSAVDKFQDLSERDTVQIVFELTGKVIKLPRVASQSFIACLKSFKPPVTTNPGGAPQYIVKDCDSSEYNLHRLDQNLHPGDIVIFYDIDSFHKIPFMYLGLDKYFVPLVDESWTIMSGAAWREYYLSNLNNYMDSNFDCHGGIQYAAILSTNEYGAENNYNLSISVLSCTTYDWIAKSSAIYKKITQYFDTLSIYSEIQESAHYLVPLATMGYGIVLILDAISKIKQTEPKPKINPLVPSSIPSAPELDSLILEVKRLAELAPIAKQQPDMVSKRDLKRLEELQSEAEFLSNARYSEALYMFTVEREKVSLDAIDKKFYRGLIRKKNIFNHIAPTLAPIITAALHEKLYKLPQNHIESNLNELARLKIKDGFSGKFANLIHAGQIHASYVPQSLSLSALSAIGQSQLSIIHLILANPDYKVFSEGLSSCVTEQNLSVKVIDEARSCFPTGEIPKEFSALTLPQKYCIVKHGAELTLLAIGKITTIYPSSNTQFEDSLHNMISDKLSIQAKTYSSILAFLPSKSEKIFLNRCLKEFNRNSPIIKDLREIIALEECLRVAEGDKGILVYGNAHDFKRWHKPINYMSMDNGSNRFTDEADRRLYFGRVSFAEYMRKEDWIRCVEHAEEVVKATNSDVASRLDSMLEYKSYLEGTLPSKLASGDFVHPQTVVSFEDLSQISEPVLFHSNQASDIVFKSTDITFLSYRDITKRFGFGEFLFTINQDGKLLVADKALNEPVLRDGYEDPWLRHPEMVDEAPVLAAGTLLTHNGFQIIAITNQTGHYYCGGKHLKRLIEDAFYQFGFNEEALNKYNDVRISGQVPITNRAIISLLSTNPPQLTQDEHLTRFITNDNKVTHTAINTEIPSAQSILTENETINQAVQSTITDKISLVREGASIEAKLTTQTLTAIERNQCNARLIEIHDEIKRINRGDAPGSNLNVKSDKPTWTVRAVRLLAEGITIGAAGAGAKYGVRKLLDDAGVEKTTSDVSGSVAAVSTEVGVARVLFAAGGPSLVVIATLGAINEVAEYMDSHPAITPEGQLGQASVQITRDVMHVIGSPITGVIQGSITALKNERVAYEDCYTMDDGLTTLPPDISKKIVNHVLQGITTAVGESIESLKDHGLKFINSALQVKVNNFDAGGGELVWCPESIMVQEVCPSTNPISINQIIQDSTDDKTSSVISSFYDLPLGPWGAGADMVLGGLIGTGLHGAAKNSFVEALASSERVQKIRLVLDKNRKLVINNTAQQVKSTYADVTVEIYDGHTTTPKLIKLNEINANTVKLFTNLSSNCPVEFCIKGGDTITIGQPFAAHFVQFLKQYKLGDANYDCNKFMAQMQVGLHISDASKAIYSGYTKKLDEKSLSVGDIICLKFAEDNLSDPTQALCDVVSQEGNIGHWAVYLDDGYYIQLFGKVSPIIISTLPEMFDMYPDVAVAKQVTYLQIKNDRFIEQLHSGGLSSQEVSGHTVYHSNSAASINFYVNSDSHKIALPEVLDVDGCHPEELKLVNTFLAKKLGSFWDDFKKEVRAAGSIGGVIRKYLPDSSQEKLTVMEALKRIDYNYGKKESPSARRMAEEMFGAIKDNPLDKKNSNYTLLSSANTKKNETPVSMFKDARIEQALTTTDEELRSHAISLFKSVNTKPVSKQHKVEAVDIKMQRDNEVYNRLNIEQLMDDLTSDIRSLPEDIDKELNAIYESRDSSSTFSSSNKLVSELFGVQQPASPKVINFVQMLNSAKPKPPVPTSKRKRVVTPLIDPEHDKKAKILGFEAERVCEKFSQDGHVRTLYQIYQDKVSQANGDLAKQDRYLDEFKSSVRKHAVEQGKTEAWQGCLDEGVSFGMQLANHIHSNKLRKIAMAGALYSNIWKIKGELSNAIKLFENAKEPEDFANAFKSGFKTGGMVLAAVDLVTKLFSKSKPQEDFALKSYHVAMQILTEMREHFRVIHKSFEETWKQLGRMDAANQTRFRILSETIEKNQIALERQLTQIAHGIHERFNALNWKLDQIERRNRQSNILTAFTEIVKTTNPTLIQATSEQDCQAKVNLLLDNFGLVGSQQEKFSGPRMGRDAEMSKQQAIVAAIEHPSFSLTVLGSYLNSVVPPAETIYSQAQMQETLNKLRDVANENYILHQPIGVADCFAAAPSGYRLWQT